MRWNCYDKTLIVQHVESRLPAHPSWTRDGCTKHGPSSPSCMSLNCPWTFLQVSQDLAILPKNIRSQWDIIVEYITLSMKRAWCWYCASMMCQLWSDRGQLRDHWASYLFWLYVVQVLCQVYILTSVQLPCMWGKPLFFSYNNSCCIGFIIHIQGMRSNKALW